jgi:MoaA/NifB/PqqE/SkfB family radical SAM enzyme
MILSVLKSNLGLGPYKLTMHITDRCNSRCTNCRIWQKKQGREISADDWGRLLEKNSFPWIDLTGGEIFLHDEIETILHTAGRKSRFLHFATNGTMPKKVFSIVEDLSRKERRKLVVSVSIDGPKRVHEKTRGTSWNKAFCTFLGLKSRGVEAYIGYTISRHNTGMLKEMLDEMRNHARVTQRDVHVNVAQQAEYYNNRCRIEPAFTQDIDYALNDRGVGLFQALEKRYLTALKKYVLTGKAPWCAAGRASITVDSQGGIRRCLFKPPHANILNSRYELVLPKREKCRECFTACEAYPTLLSLYKG